MATIDGLGLQEPSTITKSLAVIPITRNSSVTYQEIMVIGDPDSTTSSAVAKVTNAAAASTAWGLVTRPVGPITVVQSTASDLLVNVSSVAGAVNIRSSAANALVTVYQSTAADLNVTVANLSTTVNVSSVSGEVAVRPASTNWASSAGFHFDSSGALNVAASFSGSTTVNVSSITGPVTMRSSAANALVTVYQSTAADLNVTVAGYSTIVAVSSLGGRVTTMPLSTVWASSAGFHFDSSGALLTNAAFTGSTTVSVARTVGNSSAADFMPVRLVDSSGTGFLAPGNEYSDGSTQSTATGPALMFNNGSNATMRMVGVTQPLPTQLITSSGASVMDSTESAIKVNVVAGAAGGSTLQTVRQSTYTDFNANVRLSDRDASSATANITNTTPASTAYALAVREVVAQSTGPFVISSIVGPVNMRSSAANALVTVYQSTAADLNVTVAGYSTTVAVSSIAGPVTVRSSAANALVSVYQSTITDLLATVQIRDSSGVGIVGTTGPAAIGVNALAVRPVQPTIQSTTTFLTSSNSTALYALISSVAAVRHKVFSIAVFSTHTTPSTIVFMSSNAIDRWSVCFGSGSSGVTGANVAVSPPAWLFHADAANALNCRIENTSSQVLVRVSLAWFDEA